MKLLNKISPKKLTEFIGQKHLLAEGKFLRRMIETNNLKSCLFFGPSGVGKTALARIISNEIEAEVFEFNASISSVVEIKKLIEKKGTLFSSKKILIIIDEIHHFNKNQQDILLPFAENNDIVIIGITTQNPFFYINKALLSRFIICEFKPLTPQDLSLIIDRIISIGFENKITINQETRDFFIRFADGDARKLINFIDAASVIAKDGLINMEVVKELSLNRYLDYDKNDDYHYDITSAFIKSMRGTDPDATIYWLARMIEAGEDPLFIARRIVIAASEDVGLANSMALVVAQAAYNAVEKIGMPEARIILAHAALYVALSPKSNSSYIAIEKAVKEVKEGPKREVPLHLKDGHFDSYFFGDGKVYKYPHDYPNHYVEQQYMPNPVRFYEPTDQGNELRIREFLKKIKENEKKQEKT